MILAEITKLMENSDRVYISQGDTEIFRGYLYFFKMNYPELLDKEVERVKLHPYIFKKENWNEKMTPHEKERIDIGRLSNFKFQDLEMCTYFHFKIK